MANDMRSGSADGLDFDALDELIRQAESLDRQMRTSHPDLFAGETPSAASFEPVFAPREELAFYTGDAEAAPVSAPAFIDRLPETHEDDLPAIDEDDLQAYFLRRKFEQAPSSARWENAPEGERIGRMGEAPAQMPDEELFLHALSKLCANVADEAGSALALMEKRPGMNPLLALLPAYTALSSGASRGRIDALASRRVSNAPGEAPVREAVLLSQQMLREVMDVITESEALQEQGYKSRQEALSQAAQNVRRRLARL